MQDASEEYERREEELEAAMLDLSSEYEYLPPIPDGWKVTRVFMEAAMLDLSSEYEYLPPTPDGWKVTYVCVYCMQVAILDLSSEY